ncbi:chemotaxis protein CheW [Herbaspirillum rubrisubalbicans]|uniref:chemotaxis protein CheW n=1 Tax=Herbaspirillum rubrisubalbicans TaxID=80842 RepID=UPI0015592B7B|nr:chemotaxis protein CheW [Herbaspirillum rubrisubalbicans]NQE47696.1 chemotaxis protein CheW [Herbaspirillum rubrisubalbicans]
MNQPLFLLFSLGEERYALPTAEVAMVLPLSPCRALPGTPAWVAGLLPHGERHVPVIDLSMLALGRAAPARVSTRLVLVHYRAGLSTPVLLGLLLERATETLRADPAHFTSPAIRNEGAPYLGPVMPYQGGLLQRVQVDDLLDPATRALLYPEALA